MFRVCSLLAFLSLCAPAGTLPVEQVLEHLNRAVEFGESKISPDGMHVAWTERVRNSDGSESRKTAIYAAEVGSKFAPLRVTAGDGSGFYSEEDIAWRPDSKAFVFLSDRDEARQAQVYLAELSGSTKPKKLTNAKGEISDPAFSRDGSKLAFLYLEGAKVVGPLDAYTPEIGVLDSNIHEQRIAILDFASGAVQPITPANLFVYEFDWSPDGKQLAYTGAEGDGVNNWWIARLYAVDLKSGSQRELVKPDLQIAAPRWSPDGKNIAYIGGIMSDEGSTGGDIYLAPAEGGTAKNVTPGRKASANWLRWRAGKEGALLAGEFVDGGFAISELNTKTGADERLWEGDEQLRSASIAADGRTAAAIRSSFAQAPEVIGGKVGEWSAITHRNSGMEPLWGKSEKLHWTSAGRRVNGWLLYPKTVDPGKQYPMVVSIHGGPASQMSQSWPQSGLPLLATQDMFVFFPNPRGSYGAGEAFTQANIKDFGYGDLQDIMAGVDEVLKQAPVDPARLGVGGWSYGGFMTMWTVTQTQRFKAAVAGAGISNWQSYYGQNLIDQWMIPYFGASVYDNPAIYARSSPINFVKQVKTPTLLVVGERDAECPMPQSRELWHAFKSLGVKTQLVVYPDEGHHFRDPKHVADLAKRTTDWFRDNLN